MQGRLRLLHRRLTLPALAACAHAQRYHHRITERAAAQGLPLQPMQRKRVPLLRACRGEQPCSQALRLCVFGSCNSALPVVPGRLHTHE
jgi:hypothetical protein